MSPGHCPFNHAAVPFAIAKWYAISSKVFLFPPCHKSVNFPSLSIYPQVRPVWYPGFPSHSRTFSRHFMTSRNDIHRQRATCFQSLQRLVYVRPRERRTPRDWGLLQWLVNCYYHIYSSVFLFFVISSATSNGTSVSLSSHEGGRCVSSNMKLAIYVCNGSSG